MNGTLDPVVPYYAMDECNYQARIELREKTGIHRFLIVGPYNGVRLTGYPSDEDFRRQEEKIRAIREKVAPCDSDFRDTVRLQACQAPFFDTIESASVLKISLTAATSSLPICGSSSASTFVLSCGKMV